MKTLLTHGYFLSEDPKEQEIMKPYVPLGILYISAYLEKNGFQNEVFDSTFSDFQSIKNKLSKDSPDIIAVYTNLMTKLNVLKMIRLIKDELKLKSKIILGGPEVRHHAENFLNAGADVIVVGEGEETLLALCSAYQKDGKLPSDVDGTVVMENGVLKINNERKLVKSLNDLPVPARDKIDLTKYLSAWKAKHGYSQLSVSTMRGCPYTCKWCSRAVYGGTYRRRSPKLVVDELEQLKAKYNPDRFWFVDDVFTISRKWLKEFANEIKARNLHIAYEIISRADRMNEEVIQLLRESGCFRVWIGAESGSQKIIDAMDRRVEAKQVREMIQLAKQYGIETGTFIMLGYPGETREDIQETISHLVSSRPDHYTITIAYPIKGTPLYNEVQDKIITKLDWSESTDRDLDFKRTHARKFYEYAVRWVYNEVAAANSSSIIDRLKFRSKSYACRIMMGLNS